MNKIGHNFCTFRHKFQDSMSRYILLIAFSFWGLGAAAQEVDSVFAVRKGSNLVISYTSKANETVAMIAYRFYSTQEKIERLSMVDGRKKLEPGTELFIPMEGGQNFHSAREAIGMDHQQEIYYKVREKDNIGLIALLAGAKKQDLILWNTLHGNTLAQGQPLFIGWVKVVARDSINLKNGLAYPARKRKSAPTVDTSKHAFGELDSLYNVQTRNGTNILTEKGTVVFFDKAGSNKIFYAFHSMSQPGTVIKIFNPGSGRTIYAKVLAHMPDTKLYANSVIGICNAAKDALGVTDSKAWCELTYSPN